MNTLKHGLQPLKVALRSAWQMRTPRERQGLSLAALVIALAAVWSVALAPALRTWQQAPARQATLDKQTRQMQSLQAQALALKQPSVIGRSEALGWLETNIPKGLGADATWTLQGERLSVRLADTSAPQLAAWLVQAREQAQAIPVQAQLQQRTATSLDPQNPAAAASAPASAAQGAVVRWTGTVVLSLP